MKLQLYYFSTHVNMCIELKFCENTITQSVYLSCTCYIEIKIKHTFDIPIQKCFSLRKDH